MLKIITSELEFTGLTYYSNWYSKLLFPPFSRWRCSVWISPAFRRSLNALRVVDSDSFRSLDMVGIDGQQIFFFPARSERYMYTEIALWGKSIRYSSVRFRISYSSILGGTLWPHPLFIFCVDVYLCRHRLRSRLYSGRHSCPHWHMDHWELG